MKSAGIFLLMGLLTIWTELPSACGLRQAKPGTCPPDNIRCFREEPNECSRDFACKGRQKCCHYYCAMRCVYPAEPKPGTCPPDNIRCFREEPNECSRDYECKGPRKCCHSRCAMRCVYPA